MQDIRKHRQRPSIQASISSNYSSRNTKQTNNNHHNNGSNQSASKGHDDHLGYTYYAEAIARVLNRSEPPLCVGLYARWGSGKSFLLQQLKRCLDPTTRQDKRTKQLKQWYERGYYHLSPSVEEDALPSSAFLGRPDHFMRNENQESKRLTSICNRCEYRINLLSRMFGISSTYVFATVKELVKDTVIDSASRTFSLHFLKSLYHGQPYQVKYQHLPNYDLEHDSENDDDDDNEMKVNRESSKALKKEQSCCSWLFHAITCHCFAPPAKPSKAATPKVYVTSHDLEMPPEPPASSSHDGENSSKKSYQKKRKVKKKTHHAPPTVEYIFVDFNAWEYSHSEELWAGLIRNLYHKVEKRLQHHTNEQGQNVDYKYKWRVEKAIHVLAKRYGGMKGLRLRIVGLLVLFFTLVSGFALIGRNWKKITDEMDSIFIILGGAFTLLASLFPVVRVLTRINRETDRSRGEIIFDEAQKIQNEIGFLHRVRMELTDLFQFMHEYQEDTNIQLKLVLMIDDLDRCLDGKNVRVLEAIQLLLAIPGTPVLIFLAIDSRVLVASIEARLARSMDMKDALISGWEYMDKMVQIPFCIPEPFPEYFEEFIRSCNSQPKLIHETKELLKHFMVMLEKTKEKLGPNVFLSLHEDNLDGIQSMHNLLSSSTKGYNSHNSSIRNVVSSDSTRMSDRSSIDLGNILTIQKVSDALNEAVLKNDSHLLLIEAARIFLPSISQEILELSKTDDSVLEEICRHILVSLYRSSFCQFSEGESKKVVSRWKSIDEGDQWELKDLINGHITTNDDVDEDEVTGFGTLDANDDEKIVSTKFNKFLETVENIALRNGLMQFKDASSPQSVSSTNGKSRKELSHGLELGSVGSLKVKMMRKKQSALLKMGLMPAPAEECFSPPPEVSSSQPASGSSSPKRNKKQMDTANVILANVENDQSQKLRNFNINFLPPSMVQVLARFCHRASPNPRRLKRLMNILFIVVELARVKPASLFYPGLKLDQLGNRWSMFSAKLVKWIYLCEVFPYRISFLVSILLGFERKKGYNNAMEQFPLSDSDYKYHPHIVQDQIPAVKFGSAASIPEDGVTPEAASQFENIPDVENMTIAHFYYQYVEKFIYAPSSAEKLLKLDGDAEEFSLLLILPLDTPVDNGSTPTPEGSGLKEIKCGDILGPMVQHSSLTGSSVRDRNLSLLSYSFNLNPTMRYQISAEKGSLTSDHELYHVQTNSSNNFELASILPSETILRKTDIVLKQSHPTNAQRANSQHTSTAEPPKYLRQTSSTRNNTSFFGKSFASAST